MTFRGPHPDELISASLTGDLTAEERAALDAHMARCDICQATLAAFKSERRILSGLPAAPAPRDLAARVRTGIEGGPRAWWRRRPGLRAIGASFATVAAAALAVVVLTRPPTHPVGQASGSPQATLSSAPSPSVVASLAPSVAPTPEPAFALGPGELGYLSLNGGSLEASHLSFINDATGRPERMRRSALKAASVARQRSQRGR